MENGYIEDEDVAKVRGRWKYETIETVDADEGTLVKITYKVKKNSLKEFLSLFKENVS